MRELVTAINEDAMLIGIVRYLDDAADDGTGGENDPISKDEWEVNIYGWGLDYPGF